MVPLFVIDHRLMCCSLTILVVISIETDAHCVSVYTSCGAPCLRSVIKVGNRHYFSTVAFLFRHATAKCNS